MSRYMLLSKLCVRGHEAGFPCVSRNQSSPCTIREEERIRAKPASGKPAPCPWAG